MSSNPFARRRRAVLDSLGDGVMVLPAAPVRYRSRDTEYPYRPDSELYYLTGLTEPEAVAVLSGGDGAPFTLFVRGRDETAELWSGPRLGTEEAADRYGADAAHPLSELEARLPKLLGAGSRIYARLGGGSATERFVVEALRQARARGARAGTGPRAVVDPGEILDDLRVVKDDHEVACIRRACAATVEGHRAAAAAVDAGVGEWVVEAEINAAFRRSGGAGPAFETIVGSGPNACVLHYVTNRGTLEAGDMVLVDAGAEVGMYAGDITRTLPVSGSFSSEQRAVYGVVEAAREAAMAAAVPGGRFEDVHAAAVASLTDGLLELGVLAGSRDEALEEAAYKPFFPHQTSHWLGLDVHDVGDYAGGGVSRELVPGMVLTVEPGLYFRPGLVGGEAFEGLGVRIEDDILITEDGAENLTADLPTAPDEVEAWVGGQR